LTGSELIEAYGAYANHEPGDNGLDSLIAAVRSYALSLTRSEDTAQETALRVWQNLGSYDPSKGNFAGWVRTIAQHIRDRRRRKMVSATVAFDEDFVTDLAEASAPEDRLMSSRMRDILASEVEPEFVSLIATGLTPKEAGEALGLSYTQMRYKLTCLKNIFAASQ
jgi:RNA polymerase sigma factor (sigma-70 family)